MKLTKFFTAFLTAATLAVVACPAALADDAAPCPPPAPAPAPPPVTQDTCGCCEPPPPGCPCPQTCVPETLLCIPCFDSCIEGFQKAKADSCFKLGAGAYHWFNYNNDTDELTYGSPSAKGTYFYYFEADLNCKTCDPCTTWGFHMQLRARDQSTFRSFIDDEVWFYELYGWLKNDVGTFKVGKIWKRFGLDWDGTFYGNVAYFDGFKLDPDFGVTWERTWKPSGRFTVDTMVQYFMKEDGINGSIGGADPESTSVFTEKNTFVGRAVGTWAFTQNTSLAIGVSGYTGTVQHNDGTDDDTEGGWAIDATYQWCGLKVFGEYMQSNGTRNPAHYVTGGPSDKHSDWLVGAQYKIGMFTPRIVYSHGDYENPSGEQDLLVAGGTIELTKWLTLYLEYVKWDVFDSAGTKTKYEDGFEIIFAWHV